jgi:hypothetical protein
VKASMKTAKTLIGILAITAAFAATGWSQTCAPVTSGLVDWWPGDGNANDIAGTNNGTIPDPVNVTFDVGEVGQAFVFSGTSPGNNDTGNEVDFGANAGNFGTNNFTIDFWIKQPTNATGLYGILEKRAECNSQLAYLDIHCGPSPGSSLSSIGRMFWSCGGNGFAGFGSVFDTNKVINDGVFHHAAFVRNGVALEIYVDGVLDASNNASGIANIINSDVFRAGQTVCVGVDTSRPFVGELDELGLYDRALAPAEIYAIYQAGSEGKCKTPSITAQPQSVVVNAHNAALFSVTASGPLLSYQWSLNSTNIPGATASTLTVPSVVQTNLGTYSVAVTNAYGTATNSNATLSMYPFLVTPFDGLVTYWGQTNTLSVGAWGTGPLDYQWFNDGNAIDGATNSTLTLPNSQMPVFIQ